MIKTHAFPIMLALALLAGSVPSVADHHHHHRGGHFGGGYRGFHSHPGFGFYFGLPLFPRPYLSYPYPYYPYYPPAVVTVPSNPPVYIERSPPVTQQYSAGYWYYCSNPQGYYPYVQECPSGWRQVDPIPPR